MKRLVIAIAAVLVLAGAATYPAQGDVLQSSRDEVWFIVPDFANQELVEVSGEAHILVKETTLQDGNVRRDFRASLHGMGFGIETGQLYQVSDTYAFSTIDPAGSAFRFELRDTMRLISLGSAPNIVFGVHEIFIMDENGNASLEVTEGYDVRGRDD